MRHFKACLQIKNNAKPIFCKHQSMPFALKESIGKELDCLEEDDVLKKVNNSKWAAPIVPVPMMMGEFACVETTRPQSAIHSQNQMICLHLWQEVDDFPSWTCLRLTSRCS